MASDGLHVPAHPVRFVTAAALFDGHDSAINIMRRILQAQGAEVVHLGHNRSVDDIVTAAVQEDVQAIAISSYQGGHVEFFEYLIDSLRAHGRPDVKVFGGGGGVIVPEEIARLHAYGMARIFTPEDGARMGLARMVNTMIEAADFSLAADPPTSVDGLLAGDERVLARVITALEGGTLAPALVEEIRAAAARRPVPRLGITGTGGSGKSSLTDELVRRFRIYQEDKLRIAVVAVDPTRRKAGGALLGDRIRMNALEPSRVYFRSMATRGAVGEVPPVLADVIAACQAAGHDVVIVETPGIGQGDAGVVPYVDVPIYVMTPEFGAASQLEKIEMLDHAEAVVINKFDRRGAEDALRDVRRQLQRLREDWSGPIEALPVFGTVASRFADEGVTALSQYVRDRLAGEEPSVEARVSTGVRQIVPSNRTRYLGDVADTVRRYHAETEQEAATVRLAQHLRTAQERVPSAELEAALRDAERDASGESQRLLEEWPEVAERYRSTPAHESLSGSTVPRVAVPRFDDEGALLRWLRRENLPGRFPFTAGVFPFKREDEDPTRMFAGEGDPQRTNRRFHFLAGSSSSARLSTAFDSVTLYGYDPDERPDIYGKVGNSGVSIATLDDMKVLYDGFDLLDPKTSVSMTINGPAPAILAMFLNTAVDQRRDADPAWVLENVRGTVQADILKEDQGQNTCIFSTEFALRMMADIQEWFVEHRVRNFYSVSISGYHIAEAGANPISQLAFTLANGFTYVEAYLARGMSIDDFAPNFSFFFSNGMDPEYSVLGRVARRIWAVAMRERYGANERSQRLKYHVQTSGRSLHAQEMAFNDIRTTLQALIAVYDNCNSLHTNAYDEAVTTPTEESLRRAIAIQLIINKEWGLAMNENPLQGAFIVDELTDLVEEAVLREFERLDERGGVLGAMETGYQRGRIQDEAMLYEQRKHDGTLPIVGVNTFRNPSSVEVATPPLARSTEEEKQSQLRRLREFQERHRQESPEMLDRLRETALSGGNVFAVLMEAVRCCSLGQISQALFEVGGRYRRNV